MRVVKKTEMAESSNDITAKASLAIGRDYYGESMRGHDFKKGEVQNVIFEEVDITDTKLSSHKIVNVELKHSIAKNVCFANSALENVVFDNVDLRGADFSNATMKSVMFKETDIEGVDFSGVGITEVDFIETDVSKAKWSVKTPA